MPLLYCSATFIFLMLRHSTHSCCTSVQQNTLRLLLFPRKRPPALGMLRSFIHFFHAFLKCDAFKMYFFPALFCEGIPTHSCCTSVQLFIGPLLYVPTHSCCTSVQLFKMPCCTYPRIRVVLTHAFMLYLPTHSCCSINNKIIRIIRGRSGRPPASCSGIYGMLTHSKMSYHERRIICP